MMLAKKGFMSGEALSVFPTLFLSKALILFGMYGKGCYDRENAEEQL
jgi:hypothetical protein